MATGTIALVQSAPKWGDKVDIHCTVSAGRSDLRVEYSQGGAVIAIGGSGVYHSETDYTEHLGLYAPSWPDHTGAHAKAMLRSIDRNDRKTVIATTEFEVSA